MRARKHIGISSVIVKSFFLSKSSLGFTLIEIIVVFAVLAVISVAGLASFVSYSRQQALVTEVNTLTSVINLARSNAISQVKPSTKCVGANLLTLDGYIVTLITTGDKNTYTLGVACGPGSDPGPTVYTFPQTITFDPVLTNVSTIYFRVLTGGVILKNSAGNEITNGSIVLENESAGLSKSITIDNSGKIE
ncbi:MAG: GspH/FimT family pseudopilin [Candidatus Levybacteria bacterium]|nr:GspH/FimT family pseudopilin [Candidatus Levybacteria bacterium]